MHTAPRDVVFATAGADAALYLEVLNLCEDEEEEGAVVGVPKENRVCRKPDFPALPSPLDKELFMFATFWTLATVLPVNLVGRQVAALRAEGVFTPNEFTYWAAPGAPPLPPPPGYDWRRDDANAPSSYDLSDLDRMTVRVGGGEAWRREAAGP